MFNLISLKVQALLFFEFFKVGLFTFGGGYASLPFLYSMIDNYHWFSNSELTQMIAISGLTPGPIGLNMATYCGYTTFGLMGGIISSMALILPMLIITSNVFRLFKKFSENEYVKSVLYVLRPTSCALILSVGVRLFYNLVIQNHDYNAIVLLVILFALSFKLPRNPIYYMVIAGLYGIFSSMVL